MELEEAKEIIQELKQYESVVENHEEAIDTVISELFAMQNLLDEKNEELDRLQEENKNLRDLYLRTAKKLDENGKEELADYFLAQIGAVPTLSPQ